VTTQIVGRGLTETAAEGARRTDATASSFPALLVGVAAEPAAAFREIVARRNYWAPLVAFTLLQVLFAWVWLDRVDMYEYARAQAAAVGNEPPPGPVGDASLYDFVKFAIGASMATFTPLVVLATAGLMLFVFNFFMGAETEFRQCLAVCAWASLAVGLIAIPGTLLVLALRSDWNMDPQNALATHLGTLLDQRDVAPALYSVAQSLDLLSFWNMYLLAVGMALASGRSTRSAVTVLASLWGSYGVGKALIVALIS
jgi:hypothetical protein